MFYFLVGFLDLFFLKSCWLSKNFYFFVMLICNRFFLFLRVFISFNFLLYGFMRRGICCYEELVSIVFFIFLGFIFLVRSFLMWYLFNNNLSMVKRNDLYFDSLWFRFWFLFSIGVKLFELFLVSFLFCFLFCLKFCFLVFVLGSLICLLLVLLVFIFVKKIKINFWIMVLKEIMWVLYDDFRGVVIVVLLFFCLY